MTTFKRWTISKHRSACQEIGNFNTPTSTGNTVIRNSSSYFTSAKIGTLFLSALLALQYLPASAATQVKDSPSGTLLIPISPKLDTEQPSPSSEQIKSPNEDNSASSAPSEDQVTDGSASEAEKPVENADASTGNADEMSTDAAEKISPEQGSDDNPESKISEDTTLKGTIQLIADDTEYDQEKNTFLGTGNAVVILAGQNSKLEADTVLYDQNDQLIDARGNVRIYRNGQLTTGSSFKFNVTSDEYLITNPDTEINGTTVVARKALGLRKGIVFRNGVMDMPNPIHFINNTANGPMTQETTDRRIHPEGFLPATPSYKFTARKMIYERYKEQGNLTIFGGKLLFGNFNFPIPLPKFTLTVGQENKRVVFPITPIITNNLQMGGTSIGPNFSFAEGKNGVFSVAPMIQIGGKSQYGTSSKFGPAVRLGFTNDRITSHFAYGNNTHLVVADFKYKINRATKFQAGINRFMDDGLFGYTRARLLAEVVNNKSISVPYLAYVNFRSSAGWAQDDPSSLGLNPQYAKLFSVTHTGKTSAMRFQEQVSASSHPLFTVGDNVYGARMMLFGGAGVKYYSTGDHIALAQFGPILDVFIKRVRLRGGYTQAVVNGRSPFIFDQYIQGSRSVNLNASYKVNKYLTLGVSTGYNLVNKLAYQKTLSAAVGPEDCKLMMSYDTISKYTRYGFDILFGQPIPFSKLVLKGGADQGQLGGI